MMNDLISRQSAIDEIGEWIKAFRENGHKESAADACLIQNGIIQLPSAQPEIIRCKDCRYAHLTRDGKCKYCDTWTDVDGYPPDLYVEGEFYCGNAERRTDG